ncbi:MAG: two-component sensor histidine kinase [Proteobacteria bacterium]|nr:two-component sensor histidine kinase [Pseudomonadota bacterium]MBU1717325.1 two-component sensor histidine kinase [Pseudomonadota bacterium]
MTSNSGAGAANIKPFRLVKFFSFTGLVVFLVFTVVLSWIISKNTQEVLLKHSEDYAQVFARNINHQVFQQFVLPTVLRHGKVSLRNKDQFRRLDAIVRNITHGLSIESVSILDVHDNVTTYSTNSGRVGKKEDGVEGYRMALRGDSSSQLMSNGSLLSLLPGNEPIRCQLVSYIPFRSEVQLSLSTNVIIGVIEVVQDLSEDFEATLKLQGMIIITSFLIMSSLFVVLWFIVARADRIIEARARERRRLEERLHQSERLASLGKMVASVSHEIKNPLGIVKSTAEILQKRLKQIAPENEHLTTVIIEETVRLDGIVREFLDFARPKPLKLNPASLNEVISQAVNFMAPDLKKHRISLKLELDDNLPFIEMDRDLLYRAFLNIILNAVQAMVEGGELKVVTRRSVEPESVVVIAEIMDTGAGITEEKKEKIFNPFFTDKNRGTGLGLAIVKNILDSHRGLIEVESEAGRGTTFRIIFART